jgi:hypothetical protein
MAAPLRLSILLVSSALVLLSGALAQRRLDDSLVCAASARDWSKLSNEVTAEAARTFLRDRVKPECAALAERVRSRIKTLEVQNESRRATDVESAKEAARPAPSPTRKTATAPPPVRTPRKIHTPAPSATLRPSRPHFSLDPAAGADLRWWQPNWFQVLAKFPDLEGLFDRGSEDLCAACLVGASGFLEDCHIAGAAAADALIREGAKRMMSMIHISKLDGSPAAGRPIGVPVHFGRLLPPPPGGYCSNPRSDFRP